MDDLHLSAWMVSLAGALIGILLTVIAYFLNRMVDQFDKLSGKFDTLNGTLTKLDKDLSGEVGVIKAHADTLREDVDKLDSLWDRVRFVESKTSEIQAKCGACDVCTRHI